MVKTISSNSTSSKPMLSIDNISYQIDRRPLFLPVTQSFAAGECWQILGENGAGKSTLLRIMSGLLLPSTGDVDLYEQTIAYVGHAQHCKNELSVIENLHWLLALYSDADKEDASINKALAFWGILQYKHQSFRLLSAGQKKRVILTWLSLRSADVWLLDEPFSALDQDAVAQLWHEIKLFVENGGTVLFASHQNWNDVSFCQRMTLEKVS